MNMYDLALWKHYSVTVFDDLNPQIMLSQVYQKSSSATKEWKACLSLVYLLLFHCPVLIS